MSVVAIVVGAGRGTRLGETLPKAFLPLGGVPMAVYPLRTLSRISDVHTIVFVVGAEATAHANDLLAEHGPWAVPIRIVQGGTERQDSVAAGLAVVDTATDLVLVHDAARPFVSPSCVRTCIERAQTTGAAIVALPAHDTVKKVAEDGLIIRTLDRRTVWLAQTPQVFRLALLREAYASAGHTGFQATDDAALVERLGLPVHVVAGDATNRKITTPEDLQWAEWYLHNHRGEVPGSGG